MIQTGVEALFNKWTVSVLQIKRQMKDQRENKITKKKSQKNSTWNKIKYYEIKSNYIRQKILHLKFY